MATSAESMAALMAEARAEQSLISAQLKALRGEVPEAAPSPRGGNTSPSHAADLAASFAESRPAGSSPLSSPSAWASPRAAAPSRGAGLPGVDEELSALRAHVADLDSELLQRDAAIDNLQRTLRETQDTLQKALLSPQEGGLWKDRYHEAQKQNETRGREVNELGLKLDTKEKEIKLLSQYVRKLEEEARIRDSQRERLLTDASISRSKFKQTESDQKQLVSRLHSLEDSFARCIGRVTQALTAGVVGVCIDEAQPLPRFVVLSPRPGGSAILEIFEEPDSHWELAAVELSPMGVGKKPPVTLDENALSLVTCGISGGGAAYQEAVSSPALKCPDKASFAKWTFAFRNLGLLPQYGAVASAPSSPQAEQAPTSPMSPARGARVVLSTEHPAALAQKDEALTETRLNSLLGAVEGNLQGEQRLEKRLMLRACAVVIRIHLPKEERKENLLLLCYLRAYYVVAAWEDGIHWVNSHGSCIYLYCDTAVLGLRIALRMQRLVFEFPEWAEDGYKKDCQGCSTLCAVSVGMELGSLLPLRGDFFGEAVDAAIQMEELASPGELLISSAACASGLEDQELRLLRDSGCLELSQRSALLPSGHTLSCLCAVVPESQKLAIPMARANPPGIEAAVDAIGPPEGLQSKSTVVLAAHARSIGLESRAQRRPMETLRLLLKFRETVATTVNRTGGKLCWYQGHRVAAVFDSYEVATACAEEAQKEMALHNATRKGDFQLGIVCAIDFGQVWMTSQDTAGPVLWRALHLARLAGKVGDILITEQLARSQDEELVKAKAIDVPGIEEHMIYATSFKARGPHSEASPGS